MSHDMRCGVLYVATGRMHIEAAMASARAVRARCPGLPVHLFADWRAAGVDLAGSTEPFTSVGEVERPHRRSKIDYLAASPFERTLYLDTDTRVLEDITPLFAVLDRFDIALAHAHNRVTRQRPWRVPVPEGFPQLNAGVILYRRAGPVEQLLRDWRAAFHAAGFRSDQVTLRELLWLSDLRLATLPPEYNVRYLKYLVLWARREARPRILHLEVYHGVAWWLHHRWRRLSRALGLSWKGRRPAGG